MQHVDIYIKDTCPYCVRALALLKSKGVTPHIIDITLNDEKREAMIARASGKRTVPQIFIGQTHVGGCDDLHALEAAGKLNALLQG
jgi:glutaredoxin 3